MESSKRLIKLLKTIDSDENICHEMYFQELSKLLQDYKDVWECDFHFMKNILKYTNNKYGIQILNIFFDNGYTFNSYLNKYESEQNLLLYVLEMRYKLEIIEFLIKHGDDVNFDNIKYSTPLHYALKIESNPDVIELLIKHGADINHKDLHRCTPLNKMLMSNMKIKQIGRMLIINNSYIPFSLCDNNVYSLHYGTRLRKLINIIIKNGMDINDQNQYGNTILHHAITNKTPIYIVKILLDAGIDHSIKNKKGNVALYYADKVNFIKIYNIILQQEIKKNNNKMNKIDIFHKKII